MGIPQKKRYLCASLLYSATFLVMLMIIACRITFVRGKVTAINYQCVQAETIEGTEMSFLNSSLFGKNFNNLTRNNSYELTIITVGVAYGTEIQRVREVLVKGRETFIRGDCHRIVRKEPPRLLFSCHSSHFRILSLRLSHIHAEYPRNLEG